MTPKLYTAIKWGALLGGPLAIFETWSQFSAIRSQNLTDYSIVWCLTTMLEALIPLIAGLLAARDTGERRSGLLAGLTAAIIVAIVNIIADQFVPPDAFAQASNLPPATTLELILDWVLARAITLGLGAWFGWLGGRLGVVTLQQQRRR